MRYKWIPAEVLLLAVILGCGDDSAMQTAPPPEVPVFVTKAEQIPIKQDFVGQIYGYKDIAIRARLEGFLEGVHIQEGSEVKRGALLYTLESQPFEADEAAKLSNLAEARTALAKTKSDLDRTRPLAEQNAVSQSDLDAAVALYEAAIAGVEAAQANLRASRIQLSYTKMHSPITGIIGKTLAKVGDFVGKNPNPVILNTVSRLDTILVEFFITEKQYLQLHRDYTAGGEAREETASLRSSLELLLADGSLFPATGTVVFVDRQVDTTTGALLVQCSFPNDSGLLRPGLFAKIRVIVEVRQDAIRIPQRCVAELQGRFSVFVVGADDKVERREIVAGPKIDNFWVIDSGLEAGDRVVYEGLQRLRDGLQVKPIVKDIQPQKLEGS